MADRLGNDVLVYFGNADGTFPLTPSYSISVGFEPSAVTAADFNDDGVLDLAVANQGSNDVSVLGSNPRVQAGSFRIVAEQGCGQARDMSEHITHTAAVQRLERSTSDRKLAGVAGGLGRYFDLNPSFFRIGFVVLTLLGGAGLLIYLVAAFVMPDEGKDKSIAEQVLADRRDRPWPLVGLALAGVAIVVLLSHATVWPAAGAGWILVLFAGLAILWASRADRRAGRDPAGAARS